MLRTVRITIILFTSCIIGSCKKEFLETPTSGNLSQIRTLDDCRDMLNYKSTLSETPVLGEISSGDYFVTDTLFGRLSKTEQNAYMWLKDIYEGAKNIADYNFPYDQVHIADEVLT